MSLVAANLWFVQHAEIIKLLGGPTAVARLLGIKPPSVHRWTETGIPDLRLIELGAEIERRSCGRVTRRDLFPERFGLIWPELANHGAADCQEAKVDSKEAADA